MLREAKDGVRWRESAAGVAAGHEVAQPGQVEGQQRRHAGVLTFYGGTFMASRLL